MYSTGVGLVLKGFQKRKDNNSNLTKGDSVNDTENEQKSNSLLAKFASFFEDEID